MIREVIVPANNEILVVVPDDYIGKTIEVIAFAVEEGDAPAKVFRPTFEAAKIDTLNFKFNRDEANER